MTLTTVSTTVLYCDTVKEIDSVVNLTTPISTKSAHASGFQTPKFHQNRMTLVERYGDLTIFNMAAVRHLEFKNN